ncbi:MAG: glycoside hydrolase family 16 protein [Bacilli bacterium]|nr:glycoside hydrolase family 16 protein [Bacilli bacterium]
MKSRNLFITLFAVILLSSCTIKFGADPKASSQTSSSSEIEISSATEESTSVEEKTSIVSEESSTKETTSSEEEKSSSKSEESIVTSEESSISSEESSIEIDSPYVPSGYSLAWSDEFEGNSLNKDYWEPQIGNGWNYGQLWEWGNAEKQYYKEENISVSQGKLNIIAKKEYTYMNVDTSYNYTSARLRTMGKVSTTYGYIEAKISLPVGNGMWPAFWMLPESNFSGSAAVTWWPTSGEIDIMEARGRLPYEVGATTHSSNQDCYDAYHTNSYQLSTPISEDHIYACLWTENYIKFSCDGVVYNTVDAATWRNGASFYSGAEPFNAPFHIILNLAVGGNYDGGVMPDSTFTSATMSVDYVRIYHGN